MTTRRDDLDPREPVAAPLDPPPPHGPADRWRGALAGAALWLAAMAAAGAGLAAALGGAEGPMLGVVAALAFVVTAPFAILLALSALSVRLDSIERRAAALHRVQSRMAADLPRLSARPAESPGARELASAMAAATRDALDAERSAMARRIAEIAEAQRRMDLAIDALAQARAGAPVEAPAQAPEESPAPAARAQSVIPNAPPREAPAADADQASLPLTGQSEAAAAEWSVIAVALDFPKDETDAEGFAALEAALRDPSVSVLLQAAEDALTLLAQHGIYMEDLPVRLAPAAAWASFARGARGPDVAAVGGVEDADAVASVRAMMKADPIFRDTAMHLMRRFDGVLRRAVADPRAAPQITAMADSRTGRAFMLVAQAVGAFD